MFGCNDFNYLVNCACGYDGYYADVRGRVSLERYFFCFF